MKILQIDELLRSLKQNINSPHSLFLGAGASIESGVQSANDCIWDWKKAIFLSQNSMLCEYYTNIKSETARSNIQKWIDNQGVYPQAGSDDEYSYYAEKAFPIERDRERYFQNLVGEASPSLGYHLISCLAETGFIKTVWTTNFDGLMEKCAHQYKLAPISITGDTCDRFYRNEVPEELLTIALHGDYKYGKLKNTATELDRQSSDLIKALKHKLTNEDLLVFGYSGRDISIMQALKESYSARGSGKLFWCGYGDKPIQSVINLIDEINKNGREAYYISTNGFDETLYLIARYCLSEDKEYLAKIDKIKTQLANHISKSTADFTTLKLSSISKVVATNLYPIAIPQNCYQFHIYLSDNESPWDYCRILYKQDIMAVPYKGLFYAWGEKSHIEKICKDRLRSPIDLTPFDKDLAINVGVFKRLLLKTIVSVLAKTSGLKCSKDKIWDVNSIIKHIVNAKQIIAYEGLKVSVVKDNSYIYLSFSPSFHFDESVILSQEERKQFSDFFYSNINNRKPNYYVEKYIRERLCRINNGNKLILYQPTDSNEKIFRFIIGCNNAKVKVQNGNYNANIPNTIAQNSMVFPGIECRDPSLIFFDSQKNEKVTHFHPMKGLCSYAPIDYPINIGELNRSISLGIICPKVYREAFYNFLLKFNSRCNVQYNLDYVISYPGFFEAFKTNLNIPTINDERWQDVSALSNTSEKEYCENLMRKIDQLNALQVDVVIIYVPKAYESLTINSDIAGSFDLHDYIKAYAAQQQISTQFIREKTIESSLLCQILWALSLAIYVKSNRIPWYISSEQNDTAFAGIGYSVRQSGNGGNVVIGCSHVYSSDGQGLKYKLSKISDVTFDKKNNPYLSENQAYKLGLNIKELFYKSFSEMPKRVVIHKRTPYKREEIKGLTESLSSAGIKDIELLEISYEEDIKCFAYNKDLTEIDGFPVRRGLCIPVNKNTMLLFTHGIAPSVQSPNYKYIQGGKTIPLPLKIVSHYGCGSMQQIAKEILGLTKMNWNSFGLYTKLPCTIDSSNEIARIGWLLSKYEGTLYEYRFFM